jgi:HAD superfamily hydrolase (TIGR01509 family)
MSWKIFYYYMIDGVIFDFDGLLMDTESAIYEAWREIYQDHGSVLEFPVWAQCIGRADGYFDPVKHLEGLIGMSLDSDAVNAHSKKRHIEIAEGLDLFNGARERLSEARALGLRVGLASSSTRKWVEGYLIKHGIREHFQTVRTRDDVVEAKPHPELYQLAAGDLSLDPSRTLALEDSPNGALAAVRAGLKCIIVPNRLTSELSFPEVFRRVGSLSSFTFGEYASSKASV